MRKGVDVSYILKKLRYAVLIIFVLLLALCGCAETPASPPAGSESWGIYIYLCGSNLETKMGAAGKNIDEILAADIPQNVDVVIETGGAQKWRSHDIPNDKLSIYSIKNGQLYAERQSENASMGEGETLSDFIAYCLENHPAKRKALVLWDHGGGASGEVCFDENYSMEGIAPAELKKALTDNGAHFDIFGFDACLMASNETAALIHGNADYMLASEEIVPLGGWNYGALIESLAQNNSVEEVCKSVADGFIKKCESASGGRLATMSVFDLKKYGDFSSAFEGFAQSLTDAADRQYGNFNIISASEQAVKFGAIGRDEGSSNLIDLYDFAQPLSKNNAQAASLLGAIKSLVPYTASASATRKNLGGVSVFFPLYFDKTALTAYCNGCSSQAYKAYLTGIYLNDQNSGKVFSDEGSVGADGCFRITLDEEIKKYLKSVDFSIVGVEDDPEATVSMVQMGIGDDVKADWDSLTFESNFRGSWLALDGVYLNYSVIEDCEECTVFTAPVIVGGERTNLRFEFIKDGTGGGYYKIIGLWEGIDEFDFTDRGITPLKEGDEITVMCKRLEPESTKTFDDTELSEGETIIIGSDGGKIAELPLKSPSYYYVFVVNDIFGNRFYSKTADMKMKYTYEELLENPLPDGEYAAEIEEIFEYLRWGAVG